jgi:hypothetical protein
MKKTINIKMPGTKYLLAGSMLLLSVAASAQRDTTKKGTSIDIISSYQPVLRNAVKVNFSATHLNADSTRPALTYNIPAQNLFYSYQPVSLKPLALQQDTNLYLGQRNFVKIGYGNFQTPYASVGLSFGDGKKVLANVYADYISSKGKIQYQQYAQFNANANLSYFTKRNEIYGGVSFKHHDYNLYGYDKNAFVYSKKDVRQQFVDVAGKIGMRNTVSGEYGIYYDPSIEVSNFTLRDRVTENSFLINAPVEKRFGDVFAIKLAAKADFTKYTTKGIIPNNYTIDNNIFQISPSIAFTTPRASINAGIIPTWDNGQFEWLPNVFAEAQVKENTFWIQAGWVGRYTKNNFRNLTRINPYLTTLNQQLNTKEIEYYGGVKLSVAKHFNVNAKVGWVQYNNLPFFINDTAVDNKAFTISNETRVNNLRVHGDISYINQDKFTATAGVTFNGYTGMKSNAKAWHTIPFEFTGAVRWWALKQVLLKADFYAFGGGHYLDKGNVSRVFKPGSDLSAGAEFKINKTFSAWMDVNNILNSKYERWHNYEVLGLNFIGGVKVNF